MPAGDSGSSRSAGDGLVFRPCLILRVNRGHCVDMHVRFAAFASAAPAFATDSPIHDVDSQAVASSFSHGSSPASLETDPKVRYRLLLRVFRAYRLCPKTAAPRISMRISNKRTRCRTSCLRADDISRAQSEFRGERGSTPDRTIGRVNFLRAPRFSVIGRISRAFRFSRNALLFFADAPAPPPSGLPTASSRFRPPQKTPALPCGPFCPADGRERNGRRRPPASRAAAIIRTVRTCRKRPSRRAPCASGRSGRAKRAYRPRNRRAECSRASAARAA